MLSSRLQRELCKLFEKIGALGAALDLYASLKMWEDVISCHIRMGKVAKVVESSVGLVRFFKPRSPFV